MSRRPRKNLAGQRFGRLVVVRNVPDDSRKTMLECKCDCGKVTVKNQSDILRGCTSSCGCLRREVHIAVHTTHGFTTAVNRKSEEMRLFRVWYSMRERCTNPNNTHFQHYGGRGIKVCDEWQEFANFVRDMGMRPTPKHQIDREETNGDYTKSNCRWVLPKQQQRNRRNNQLVIFQDREMTIAEFAEIVGIKYATAYWRIVVSGWAPQKAASEPVRS